MTIAEKIVELINKGFEITFKPGSMGDGFISMVLKKEKKHTDYETRKGGFTNENFVQKMIEDAERVFKKENR